MDADRARKIANGKSKWRNWKKQRLKQKIFLYYYDVYYLGVQEDIKESAEKQLHDCVTSYEMTENFYKNSKLDREFHEDLMETALTAVKNKLIEQGYRVSFKKGWDDIEKFYYEFHIDWK